MLVTCGSTQLLPTKAGGQRMESSVKIYLLSVCSGYSLLLRYIHLNFREFYFVFLRRDSLESYCIYLFKINKLK
jgi:hypothetical protein